VSGHRQIQEGKKTTSGKLKIEEGDWSHKKEGSGRKKESSKVEAEESPKQEEKLLKWQEGAWA